MEQNFSNQLSHTAMLVETALEKALADQPLAGEKLRPTYLMQAIRHGSLDGGKRLRPFLLLQSAALFDVPATVAMDAACALECIHCYSLIHDDLPAMDDDDLRRGKPTVHKAFDEATAILAGDALLTLAFDLLSRQDKTSLDAGTRLKLISKLSRAAGLGGMIGGQMLDIAAETQAPEEAAIKQLQSMKTGALIRFACEAGAIIGKASGDQTRRLVKFGEIIGLAFQLSDDLLDVTANAGTLGKATGKDAALGKATLVGLYGVKATRERLNELLAHAGNELNIFGEKAETLLHTAQFIINRKM